jgi:hypothetical protein
MTQRPRPDRNRIFFTSFSTSDFIASPDSGICEFRAGHLDRFDQAPDVQADILAHILPGLSGNARPRALRPATPESRARGIEGRRRRWPGAVPFRHFAPQIRSPGSRNPKASHRAHTRQPEPEDVASRSLYVRITASRTATGTSTGT